MDTVFSDFEHIRNLNLENNHLTELKATSFNEYFPVMAFNLINNTIQEIEPDLADRLIDIQFLRLSSNSFSCPSLKNLMPIKEHAVIELYNNMNVKKGCWRWLRSQGFNIK